MPSRASTSLLQRSPHVDSSTYFMCQCPLGLLPHFYMVTTIRRCQWIWWCQCPLGLLPHFYSLRVTKRSDAVDTGVNALSGCYLISTLSTSTINTICKCVNALSGCYLISTPRRRSTMTRQRIVSMPSRAVTSFLPR